jgi:hypothetical protein
MTDPRIPEEDYPNEPIKWRGHAHVFSSVFDFFVADAIFSPTYPSCLPTNKGNGRYVVPRKDISESAEDFVEAGLIKWSEGVKPWVDDNGW